uniref:Ubiquitin carboxyl-terminal hydrolase 10 n=1 Tax=Aegilops tauschii TaxID=37682 RepID=M8B1T8_AEGTA
MTIPSAEGFLPAASCLPCTAEEERAAVDALTREADANVKDGDLRYLISQSWWTNWQSYVGLLSYGENDTDIPLQPASRPGEIDNRKLVLEETSSGSEDTELQRTLREGEDYTLVPQDVWRKLYDWYAVATAQVPGGRCELVASEKALAAGEEGAADHLIATKEVHDLANALRKTVTKFYLGVDE